MDSTVYTPGHGANASAFMARRTFASHGQFFAAHLAPGLSVLDCGCGPGSITLGIAEVVDPAPVVGVDFSDSQVALASDRAAAARRGNSSFQTASADALPFADASFDRVFSHALFEHLSEPLRALQEVRRVLKPGGMVGLCSPDWGGFIVSPPSEALARALGAYRELLTRNGGDAHAGRKLGVHLAAAGFEAIGMSARYECYPRLSLIGDYLAQQLEHAGDPASAHTWRQWSASDTGLFAQSWISAIGRKPS